DFNDRIVAPKRVGHRARIVRVGDPVAVHDKQVFMRAGRQREVERPSVAVVFIEPQDAGPPFVERTGEEDVLRGQIGQSKVNRGGGEAARRWRWRWRW